MKTASRAREKDERKEVLRWQGGDQGIKWLRSRAMLENFKRRNDVERVED